MRRLYLQIYLAFLGIAAAAVCTALIAGRLAFLHGDAPQVGSRVRAAAALAGERLTTGDLSEELARLGERLDVGLVLWDAAGSRIASTPGTTLTAPDLGGPDAYWSHGAEGPAVVVRLDDGRWLGAVIGDDDRRALFTHFALVLSTLAGLIALLCYPLARRITRRLELLQRGVEGLGAGDLSTRVAVTGRDEVAEVARQFNRAADRIEALVAGQRRMLASASHELRSPLARVRMAVELLGEAAPEQKMLAAEACRDIEELDGLVGDLLLASRLEARAPVRERVDVAALLADEAARAGAVVTAAGGPVWTLGEAGALVRLLRNLLENARRHGQPPVEASVTDGAVVRVVVEDRGPGVPEAERGRIFEAFYRPAGHREGDGGVGLGLALVLQIAERHGGTARCEAREGGGSRFVVELPGSRM
jgi:two-component system OmpR family sensor kinase